MARHYQHEPQFGPVLAEIQRIGAVARIVQPLYLAFSRIESLKTLAGVRGN
ncbi:hypothetical protein FHS89_000005 [Rubricella aquisinus]|uniref:Uncharacterized protein n=1 Tax=Rubricella aquisinus TaxID=2028108 RepID=A0A840X026_9RHOB|nr:hypothetical protein [Rubricella aquisinus]